LLKDIFDSWLLLDSDENSITIIIII
jgi:hypothetical protein